MIQDRKKLKDKVRNMESKELIYRLRHPREKNSVINEAWRRMRKDRDLIERL